MRRVRKIEGKWVEPLPAKVLNDDRDTADLEQSLAGNRNLRNLAVFCRLGITTPETGFSLRFPVVEDACDQRHCGQVREANNRLHRPGAGFIPVLRRRGTLSKNSIKSSISAASEPIKSGALLNTRR